MRFTRLLILLAVCTCFASCDGPSFLAGGMLVQSEQNFAFEWPEGQTEGRVLAGTARIEYAPGRPGRAQATIVKDTTVELEVTVVRFRPVGEKVKDDELFEHDVLVIDMYMRECVDRGEFTVTIGPIGFGLGVPDQSTFTATRVKVPPIPPPNPPTAEVVVRGSPNSALVIDTVGAFSGVAGMAGGGPVIHMTGSGGTYFVNRDTGATVSTGLFDPSGVWRAAHIGLFTDNVSAPADQRYKFYMGGEGSHTITSFNFGLWGLNAVLMGTTSGLARGDESGAGDAPPQTFTLTSPEINFIRLTMPTGTTQPLIGYNIPAGQKVTSAQYAPLTGVLYFVTEQPANGSAGKIYAIDTMNPMGPAFPPGLKTGAGPVKVDHAEGIVVTANELSESIGIFRRDFSAEGLVHVTDLPAGGPVISVDARDHGDSVEVIWGTNGFLHFARVNKLDGSVTAEATVAVPGMPALRFALWYVDGGALFSSPDEYGFTGNAQQAFNLPPEYGD